MGTLNLHKEGVSLFLNEMLGIVYWNINEYLVHFIILFSEYLYINVHINFVF